MHFQMFKLVLEKAEEPEIKLPTSARSSKIERVPEKHLLLLYCLHKAFDYVDHNKLWKLLKEMGIPDQLICLLRVCMQVKKQQLELHMKQRTGSKLGKEYVNAVFCHPAYLTYGRKQRRTKKPLDENERGKYKSWLKTQHSENEDHGIWSHRFIANRWGNNANSERHYFPGLQNHCRW